MEGLKVKALSSNLNTTQKKVFLNTFLKEKIHKEDT
jgi:hypothetical protein